MVRVEVVRFDFWGIARDLWMLLCNQIVWGIRSEQVSRTRILGRVPKENNHFFRGEMWF